MVSKTETPQDKAIAMLKKHGYIKRKTSIPGVLSYCNLCTGSDQCKNVVFVNYGTLTIHGPNGRVDVLMENLERLEEILTLIK